MQKSTYINYFTKIKDMSFSKSKVNVLKKGDNMKQIGLLLGLFLLTQVAQAEIIQPILVCENKIYRDAALLLTENSVVVKDLPINLENNLAQVLEKKLNMQKGSLQTVSLVT